LIAASIVLILSLQVSPVLAGRPDFNQLKILSLSYSIDQGPDFEQDRFYPGYLSVSYRLKLSIKIERPADWDSSLYEFPDEVVFHMGRVILDLYQRDARQKEGVSSLMARWEIHPIWVSTQGEMAEGPSRIGHFVPSFLLERAIRGQIGPAEMLERGRAHLRALLREMRE